MQGTKMLYNFDDTENRIYTKKDRTNAIEKVIDKLGVSGSINTKVTVNNRTPIFVRDQTTRSLVKYNPDQLSCSFTKFLMVVKKDGSVALMYNCCVDTRTIGNTVIMCEGYFNIPDIWEAIRLVENEVIDFEVDYALKQDYGDLKCI